VLSAFALSTIFPPLGMAITYFREDEALKMNPSCR